MTNQPSDNVSLLDKAKKGYFPSWSHYLQAVWNEIAWGTEMMIETGDVSKMVPFTANYFVRTLPTLFKDNDPYALVLAGVWAIHPRAGTTWRQYIWITKKGGIFRKDALPKEEMMREIFLIKHLQEIENGKH